LAFMTCLQVRGKILGLDIDLLSPAETRPATLDPPTGLTAVTAGSPSGKRPHLAIGCASGAQISLILGSHH
jgi:hypothetical protein